MTRETDVKLETSAIREILHHARCCGYDPAVLDRVCSELYAIAAWNRRQPAAQAQAADVEAGEVAKIEEWWQQSGRCDTEAACDVRKLLSAYRRLAAERVAQRHQLVAREAEVTEQARQIAALQAERATAVQQEREECAKVAEEYGRRPILDSHPTRSTNSAPSTRR